MRKTKTTIAISIDRILHDLINAKINNKSQYIEWLIYQDLLKNKINGIDKIII